MEVIQTNAWTDEQTEMPKNKFFYGIRDLTSDYYQVMIERERPRWCRILWMIIILALLIFTGYVVYLMVNDFCQFGSYDKINTVTSNSSIILPSVTICSLNAINYTKMVEELGADSTVLEELEQLILDALLSNDNDFDLSPDDYSNLAAYEKANGPLFFLYRNDAESLLAHTSRYNYKLSNIGHNINNWLKEIGTNELGNCIELNDDSTMIQTLGGSKYGLTLDLDAEQLTYAPFTKSVGLKVLIKDHDETVFFDDGGIIVEPGTETFIEVSLAKMTRLSSSWGNCKNVRSKVSKYNTTMESRKECHQVGKVREMMNSTEHCGCIPWYVVKRLKDIGKTEILDELVELVSGISTMKRKKRDWDNDKKNYTDFYGDDAEEMMKFDNYDKYFTQGLNYSDYFCDSFSQAKCDNRFPKYWSDAQSKFATICHDPCAFNHYDVVVSSSKFPPTEKYFNGYIKEYDGLEYTWEYAKQNLIRLHVYYDRIEYRTITQTKDYEVQNFIGELGGVIDLFIGFSFFTVFQLIEILIAFAVVKKCRKARTPENTNTNTNSERGPDNIKVDDV